MNLNEMTKDAKWALLGQEHEKFLVCQNNIQLLRQSLAVADSEVDNGSKEQVSEESDES